MKTGDKLFCGDGRASGFIDRALASPLYFALLILSCAIPYVFGAYEVGFWLCAVFMSLALVLTRNILPSFAAFIFCTISVIEQYGITYEEIFGYAGVLAVVIPALIYHIFRYRKGRRGYKPGRMFLPQAAVSAALLLGGAGSISAEEYFALSPAYYVLFLGVALLAIMVFCDCDLPFDRGYVSAYIADVLIAAAALFSLMWLIAFLKDGGSGFPYRQWKNNAGNFMLLAMPLTLWRGISSRIKAAHLFFALLQLALVFLSGSRGATLMMALIFLPSLITYFVFMKDRARLLTEAALLAAAFFVFAALFLLDGAKKLVDFIENMDIFDGNGREELYKVGIENIFSHPLLGVGIGYRNDEVWQLNDMAVFWYHSTPIQIFASMGALGGAAYLWQLIARLKLVRLNAFSLSVLWGFLGFEGYSCVNTGDFTPLPFALLVVMLFLVLERYNCDLPRLDEGEGVDFVRAY